MPSARSLCLIFVAAVALAVHGQFSAAACVDKSYAQQALRIPVVELPATAVDVAFSADIARNVTAFASELQNSYGTLRRLLSITDGASVQPRALLRSLANALESPSSVDTIGRVVVRLVRSLNGRVTLDEVKSVLGEVNTALQPLFRLARGGDLSLRNVLRALPLTSIGLTEEQARAMVTFGVYVVDKLRLSRVTLLSPRPLLVNVGNALQTNASIGEIGAAVEAFFDGLGEGGVSRSDVEVALLVANRTLRLLFAVARANNLTVLNVLEALGPVGPLVGLSEAALGSVARAARLMQRKLDLYRISSLRPRVLLTRLAAALATTSSVGEISARITAVAVAFGGNHSFGDEVTAALLEMNRTMRDLFALARSSRFSIPSMFTELREVFAHYGVDVRSDEARRALNAAELWLRALHLAPTGAVIAPTAGSCATASGRLWDANKSVLLPSPLENVSLTVAKAGVEVNTTGVNSSVVDEVRSTLAAELRRVVGETFDVEADWSAGATMFRATVSLNVPLPVILGEPRRTWVRIQRLIDSVDAASERVPAQAGGPRAAVAAGVQYVEYVPVGAVLDLLGVGGALASLGKEAAVLFTEGTTVGTYLSGAARTRVCCGRESCCVMVPVPNARRVRVTSGRLVLRGTADFTQLLNSTFYDRVVLALQVDIGTALGVDVSYIDISRLSIGSLIVEYDVLLPGDEYDLLNASALSQLQQQLETQVSDVNVSEFQAFSEVYSEASENNATLTGANGETISSVTAAARVPGGAIAGGVIGAVVVVVAVIIAVGVVMHRRQQRRGSSSGGNSDSQGKVPAPGPPAVDVAIASASDVVVGSTSDSGV